MLTELMYIGEDTMFFDDGLHLYYHIRKMFSNKEIELLFTEEELLPICEDIININSKILYGFMPEREVFFHSLTSRLTYCIQKYLKDNATPKQLKQIIISMRKDSSILYNYSLTGKITDRRFQRFVSDKLLRDRIHSECDKRDVLKQVEFEKKEVERLKKPYKV